MIFDGAEVENYFVLTTVVDAVYQLRTATARLVFRLVESANQIPTDALRSLQPRPKLASYTTPLRSVYTVR